MPKYVEITVTEKETVCIEPSQDQHTQTGRHTLGRVNFERATGTIGGDGDNDEFEHRFAITLNDVVAHYYLQRALTQFQSFSSRLNVLWKLM